ncbi:MAG: magnesium transporter, partial [Cohaesibacteraceae bacterium]|nr:magnesium transporter [Cohaesibacteraceae bacterium]
RPVAISDIMNLDAISIKARDDQEDVSRLFERYDLLAAAVVDNSNRLVGVLTIDDIVDVIQEEADEDIKHLGGVGDEDISDRVLEITRSRFSWLVLNLLTAILASFIISLFDTTIENMVALAILMPIVASMGGNAATQTMTVAVRALATQDLDTYNMKRVVLRELFAATLNGVALGIITGIVAAIWFQMPELGVVIGAALIINMVSAGLCGILIPVGLDRIGIDPAVASSVFVTTVTDVVGFFAFLGIAGWWFAL